MPRQLSRTTINEYLPIIRSIQADLDARLQSPSFENHMIFRTAENTIGQKFGFRALAHVLSIICGWVKETGITTGKGQDAYCFVKTNDTGTWSRMYELIEKNLSRYEQDQKPSLLSLTEEAEGPIAKLPEGATWEDVELCFNDKYTVTIFFKGSVLGKYDYTDLGFAMKNTKDKKANKSWRFLRQLAIAQQYRKITPPTKSLFISPLETTPDGCDQIKRDLSNGLRHVFGISNDPFETYDPDVGYTTRFKLVPEPDLRGNGELHPSGGTLYEEKTSDTLLGIDDLQ